MPGTKPAEHGPLWPEAASLSLDEKRQVFENVLMKDRGDSPYNNVWSLHNLANRHRPEMARLNSMLQLTAKAGEELGYFGCLYKITNVETGQCYIGQTRRPFHMRIKDHLEQVEAYDEANTFNPLYAAIRKLGLPSFAVQVMHVVWDGREGGLEEKCEPAREELNAKERDFIRDSNSYWLKGFGYNRTSGGAGTSDIDEVARVVRDLRMAVNKYGVFALMRQVYVLNMADSGLSPAEIAKRAGYSSAFKVKQILDANVPGEKRGASVRAALPYLTEVLHSHMGKALKQRSTLESLMDTWSRQVLNTKAIYEKLSRPRQHRGIKPEVLECIEAELRSPIKAYCEMVPIDVLFVRKQPTSASKKPKQKDLGR
ncbi:hypothetical protein GCM10028813_01610 [Ramlibacter alkalitolerans]